MQNLRIVFMGTPSFAYPILEGLINHYNVVLVVCQPDKEKDRKGNVIMPITKTLALDNAIEVFQPIAIKDDYQKILDCKPDLIVTCAYGQIIPDEIIAYPKYGCINVHGSLLPKLRGGAPIHWAIINGDKKTGVTIMDMVSKMDAGDIITQKEVEILDTDNLDSLYEKMSYVGRDLLLDTILKIIDNKVSRTKQDEKLVTFGFNIKKEDEKIDFNNSAYNIYNKIRGLSSIPGAYCYLEGKRLKIYETEILDKNSSQTPGVIEEVLKDGFLVATKDKLLKIKDIQLEGKKRCKVYDFLNGNKNLSLKGMKLE